MAKSIIPAPAPKQHPAAFDIYLLVLQVQSLVCMLEDQIEVAGSREKERNVPHSMTQRMWACTKSITMAMEQIDLLSNGAAVSHG